MPHFLIMFLFYFLELQTCNIKVDLIFRVSGYIMSDKLEIPRRKVRKDWHVGLHSDPVDRSHPDVHDEQLIQKAIESQIFPCKLLMKLRLSSITITDEFYYTLCY